MKPPKLLNNLEPLSIVNPSLEWLLVVASISVILSLILAWLATLIVYARVKWLKRIFPVSHNLVRAHIDYLMMATLLGVAYFSCVWLSISLPGWVIVLLCYGVLYNPLGFVVQANNPKVGKSETLIGRIAVCIGFLPTTIGFGYTFSAIFLSLWK